MATISDKSVVNFSVIGSIGAIDAMIIYCRSVMCGISVRVAIVLILLVLLVLFFCGVSYF